MKKSIQNIKEELKMLAEDRSMPMDVKVYNYLWQMIQSIDHETPDNKLESLRKDFKESWIITNTRINCKTNQIIHDKKEISYQVPVYQGTCTDIDIAYLQALFDTKDSKEEIIQVLEFISEKNRKNIAFWTPDQNSRKSYPERAVRFYVNGRGFRVDGDLFDYYGGRSRGVCKNEFFESDNQSRTQKEWIEYWEKQGKELASASDLYKHFKALKQNEAGK